jgi:hypothetical protein
MYGQEIREYDCEDNPSSSIYNTSNLGLTADPYPPQSSRVSPETPPVLVVRVSVVRLVRAVLVEVGHY